LDDNFAQSRPDAQKTFAALREALKNQLDDLSSTQTEKQPDSNTEE
jgi:hypothetical protein